MKLFVGLGNPGEKYKNNRHNVGYQVIDELSKKKLPQGFVAKKTNVFMNVSGPAVKSLLSSYSSTHLETTDLYVVHDDLDIPLGQFKLQFAKGPKDHNGLLSVYESLGSNEFWHVRIGVDNRDPENRTAGEEYVLQDFDGDELEILDAVIKKVANELIKNA